MILDRLENFGRYIELNPHFRLVNGFLLSTDLSELPMGTRSVGDAGVTVSADRYDTRQRSAASFECHHQVVDLHIVLSGEEEIGFCPTADCVPSTYDRERDLQVLDPTETPAFFVLRPGIFALMFPHDGHMTQVACGGTPSMVSKVVMKVPAV